MAVARLSRGPYIFALHMRCVCYFVSLQIFSQSAAHSAPLHSILLFNLTFFVRFSFDFPLNRHMADMKMVAKHFVTNHVSWPRKACEWQNDWAEGRAGEGVPSEA